MQVYLPNELHDEVKRRGISPSELLPQAVRAEMRRSALQEEADRYVAELIDEVGAPWCSIPGASAGSPAPALATREVGGLRVRERLHRGRSRTRPWGWSVESAGVRGGQPRFGHVPGSHAHLRNYVVQYSRVEIHRAARRHGIADDEMLHALEHSLAVEDVGEDPDRWLVLGPDRSGNLLEVVVLVSADGSEMIIHAMAMRPIYRRLLER